LLPRAAGSELRSLRRGEPDKHRSNWGAGPDVSFEIALVYTPFASHSMPSVSAFTMGASVRRP